MNKNKHGLTRLWDRTKLKLLRTVGLNKYSPRWLKILCLQLVMNQVERGFKRAFSQVSEVDLSKVTPEKLAEVNRLIEQMNLARGKIT